MKYTNTTNFEIALHPRYEKPMDDRLQIETINELFISSDKPTNCPLYARTYVGMEVALTNGQNTPAQIYILKDNAPYLLGSAGTVNANNFSNFWYRICTTQDSSINSIEGRLATVEENVQEVSQDTISKINQSIDAINTSINTINTQINSNINASINALKTYVDTQDSAINSHINASVAAINTSINALNTQISNNINSSISSLRTYVDTQDTSNFNAVNAHIDSSYLALSDLINTTKTAIDTSYVALTQHVDSSYGYLDSSYKQMYKYLEDNEKVWANWIMTADNSIGVFQTRMDASLNTLWNSLVTKGIINADGSPKNP